MENLKAFDEKLVEEIKNGTLKDEIYKNFKKNFHYIGESIVLEHFERLYQKTSSCIPPKTNQDNPN